MRALRYRQLPEDERAVYSNRAKLQNSLIDEARQRSELEHAASHGNNMWLHRGDRCFVATSDAQRFPFSVTQFVAEIRKLFALGSEE